MFKETHLVEFTPSELEEYTNAIEEILGCSSGISPNAYSSLDSLLSSLRQEIPLLRITGGSVDSSNATNHSVPVNVSDREIEILRREVDLLFSSLQYPDVYSISSILERRQSIRAAAGLSPFTP